MRSMIIIWMALQRDEVITVFASDEVNDYIYQQAFHVEADTRAFPGLHNADPSYGLHELRVISCVMLRQRCTCLAYARTL